MSERDPRCAGSDGGHGGLVSRSRTGQDCLAVSVSPWSGEQKEGLGGEYEAADRTAPPPAEPPGEPGDSEGRGDAPVPDRLQQQHR